ncbi:DUF1010 domain-containing protein [Ottowia oryzae]
MPDIIEYSNSPFSRFYSLGFWSCAGLRLLGLRRFAVFLASSACQSSVSSDLFTIASSLPWRSVFSWAAPVFKSGRTLLAFGSNSAVKRTGLRPAAYFVR